MIDDVAKATAVRGLQQRQARLRVEVQEAEQHLQSLRADLDHVDATLAIFDPKRSSASMLRQRRSQPAHHAYEGEMTQWGLLALRNEAAPLSTLDIANRVMAERALDCKDRLLVMAVRRRVLACLQRPREQAVVESAHLAPRVLVWSLYRSPAGPKCLICLRAGARDASSKF